MMSITLPERAYCADVDYPMAVVSTANRGIIVYQLEGQPQQFKTQESSLRYQHRCISIFRDKMNRPTGGCDAGLLGGRGKRGLYGKCSK